MLFLHASFFLSSCAAETRTPQVPVWSEKTEVLSDRQMQRVFIAPDSHELVLLAAPNIAGESRLVPVKWPLHNRMEPSVRVSITPPQDILRGDRFRYEYTIGNGVGAGDNITSISLVVPAFAPGADANYYLNGRRSALWLGFVGSVANAMQKELDDAVTGKNVIWVSEWTEDLANSESVNILPGRTKDGFVLDSPEMPGFTTVAVKSPVTAPPDEKMDQKIWQQVEAFQVADYFDVTTVTFGPMFLTGAEPTEVLKNYRLGIERLRGCRSIPHKAAFLDEIAGILNEQGIETKLAVRIEAMSVKPSEPVEIELLNCLRLVARGFASRASGGKY
jgi:hypothetical protein